MLSHQRFRSVSMAQNGTLIFLLVLLFMFARGPDRLYGGFALGLLTTYHVLVSYCYSLQQIQRAGLMAAHLGVYLLLCSLVIWATTEVDEESLYWIVYLLPITVAATHLSLTRTLAVCGLAASLYAALFPRLFYIDSRLRGEELPELFILCNMFFVIGVLVQTFSEQQRRTLATQEKLNQRLLHQQKSLRESLGKLNRAEESLRRRDRLAALGQMSAGIAHEIRNPLGIISSSVQLLSRKLRPDAGDTRRLLNIVQEETDRLNGLINDFLAFGRPAQPSRQPLDMRSLVARSVDDCRALATRQRIDLQLELPDDPMVVPVDADMLRQVLLNLLLNALEATPAAGRIRTRLTRSTGRVRIEVHNSGSFIPPENRSRIFDPFFTTKDKGTGLGLANAHQMVDAHGGTLRVISTPEGGTSFVVLLPDQENSA